MLFLAPTQFRVCTESLKDDFQTSLNSFQRPVECHIISWIVTKTKHLLSITFYGHLEYTAKWIKTTKKSGKPKNSSFLPVHIGFYGIACKSIQLFSITVLTASWSEK